MRRSKTTINDTKGLTVTKILLVIDLPSTEHPITGEYLQNAASQNIQFEAKCQDIERPSGDSRRLSRNVWLLDAEKSWPVLWGVCDAARTLRIPYQVLALDGTVAHMTPHIPAPTPSGWEKPLGAPAVGSV